MNIYQRIVLILGGVTLVIALATTPKYVIRGTPHRYEKAAQSNEYFPQFVVMGSAIVRIVSVVGITVFIWWALNGLSSPTRITFPLFMRFFWWACLLWTIYWFAYIFIGHYLRLEDFVAVFVISGIAWLLYLLMYLIAIWQGRRKAGSERGA